jgi:outer membrane lipoprotein carrier protein
MFKPAKIIIAISLMASCCVMAESAPVDELQKLLMPTKTLKAQFKQTVFSEREKVLQRSSGNLEFKRPNLFRWQVDAPDKNLVVTNGKKLWNYDVDLEQVTVQAFKASNEVSPVSFLFDDVQKLNHDFTIVKITQKDSACFKHATKCFSLTPKAENASFVKVEVGFAKEEITVLRLLDHLGQTSVFEFSKVTTNFKIPDANFNFKAPAGVDVIGEQ